MKLHVSKVGWYPPRLRAGRDWARLPGRGGPDHGEPDPAAQSGGGGRAAKHVTAALPNLGALVQKYAA